MCAALVAVHHCVPGQTQRVNEVGAGGTVEGRCAGMSPLASGQSAQSKGVTAFLDQTQPGRRSFCIREHVHSAVSSAAVPWI